MRPLHSMLLLIGLVALVATAWLTLRDVQPAAPAVAPGPAEVRPTAAAGVEVAAVAPEQTARQARAAPPALPAEAPAAAREGGGTEAAPKQLVRGLVLDLDGQPVAGARVLASPEGGFGSAGIPLDALPESSPWTQRLDVRSDGNGRFELRGTRAGAMRLAVRAAGFAPWDKDDVLVPAGGDHELAPIQLEPSAILTGRVVDPNGRPVAAAELSRLPALGATVVFGGQGLAGSPVATSAADGSFTVDQLPAGAFRLLVHHAEHPDQVELGRTERPGERLDGLTIVMDHGLTIAGRITGAPEGSLEGLVVRAVPERGDLADAVGSGELPPETREAQPAADGSFLLRGTRAGASYALVARRRNQGGLAGLLGSSLSPQVFARAGDRGVELPYQPSAALVFQVVDGATRAPITEFEARAGVSFLMPMVGDDGRAVRQHPEGRARFGNLRPGADERVQLEITAVGYRTERLEDLLVRVGQDTDLGLVALDPVPLVEVTVLADASGAPLAGARVTLAEQVDDPEPGHGMRIEISAESEDGSEDVRLGDGTRHTATTDEHGIARLTSLEGRAGKLEVRHPDFAPHTGAPFRSPLTGQDEHVVRLLAGGAVQVLLTTPGGDPLAGARIDHEPPGAGNVQRTWRGQAQPVTDAEGRADFEHLAAGTHRFRAASARSGGMGFVGTGGARVRMQRGGAASAPEDEGWREVLVSEGSSQELTLVAPVRVAVHGTIYEGERPLDGALVRLLAAGSEGDPLMSMLGGGGPEARADGRGNYRLENVEAGDYTLEITHATRRMPATFDLVVAAEDVKRDLDLTVSVLKGRVTDEAGEPLAGVRLFPERASEGDRPRAMMISVMAFSDSDGGGEVVSVGDGSLGQAQATTDADGRYELRGVQPDVKLVVRAEGSSVQPGRSEIIEVGEDQTRDGVDLVLAAAGRIEVLAFTSDGKPARNLLVTAVFEGPGTPQRQSGFIEQGGRTTLEGLSPGPWRVTLRSVGELSNGPEGGGAIPDQVIDVRLGTPSTATFTTN